jgi:hypothetical protein
MAQTRALITEHEREQLAGEHGTEREWQAITRVRGRIDGPLKEDLATLAKHNPNLLTELRQAVCGDE